MNNFLNNNDVNRLLALEQADNGYFALAIHGVIEKWLRKTLWNTGTRSDFGMLFEQYKDVIRGQKRLNSEFKSSIWKIKTSHDVVNGVRHNFEQLSNEETIALVDLFLDFIRINSISVDRNIYKLEKKLDWWKERKSYPDATNELTNALYRIKQLSNNNESLVKEVASLQSLKRQIESINLQQAKLAEIQDLADKRKVKNNKLRQEHHRRRKELEDEKRELQKRAQKLDIANEYLDKMVRFSLYTRTRLDFERKIIKLTPEQMEIIALIDIDNDFLIKGSAGTGKSLVLLKALEKLSNNSSNLQVPKVRFLTLTRSLEFYNEYISHVIGIKIDRNSITTIDRTLYRYFSLFMPGKQIRFSGNKETIKFFESIMKELDLINFPELTPEVVTQEAERFIWANMITKKSYIDEMISRKGMGYPIKKENRIKIWNILEIVEEALQTFEFWPWNYAAFKMLQETENEDQKKFHCDYTFIDEVQDLPAVVVALMRKITRKALFLAGDNDQSIFQPGMSLKKAGINIVGRTKTLRTNFRNTEQILHLAEDYRNLSLNKVIDSEPIAFRGGPPPELIIGDNVDELYISILDNINFFLSSLNYDLENICIISPRKQQLEVLQEKLMSEFGLESQMVSDKDFNFDKKGIIRLSTLQSCKGLDFPVVFLLLDNSPRFQSPYDSDTIDTTQRNLVYVAITRALEHLRVFTLKNSDSAVITDLTKLLSR